MFPGHHRQIAVVIEWDPRHMGSMFAETEAYQRIGGMGIGPKFLAHLIENGDRVIGYLSEKLPAGSRSAMLKDLEVCQDVLGKLQKLGLILSLEAKYASTTRKDFQITPSGDVRITNFQNPQQTHNARDFEQEIEDLKGMLRSLRPSDDKNFLVSDAAMVAFELIRKRDGGLHPNV